jgi:hypothetical protein
MAAELMGHDDMVLRVLVLLSLSGIANLVLADRHDPQKKGLRKGASTAAAPEISPGSATAALALLSGAVLIFRGRRKE